MRLSEINFTFKNMAAFVGILAAGLIVYRTLDIIIMFLISVLTAYILNPIVNYMQSHKIGRTMSVVILVIITAALLLLSIGFILPMLIDDIVYFLSNIPEYIAGLFAFVDKIAAKLNIEISLESVKAFVTQRIGMISKYLLNTVTTAAASVKGIVMLVLNIILIPVLVFFLLKDFPKVKEFTSALTERLGLQKVMAHLAEFENLIGRYFRGMFFVGIVLSVLYIAVLLIVGVKGAFLLGLLTGMGGMIPYVGFAIGLIVSVIAAAVQFQDIWHPVYVVIGFTIVQILEGTVITPKIVGDSMGLNPVMVIFALMIGGAAFGLIGMILALPTAAFIKIMLNKYFFKSNNNPRDSLNENHSENDTQNNNNG